MNASNIHRYAIMGVMMAFAFLMMFAEPDADNSCLAWVAIMLLTKALALVTLYLVAQLWSKWEREGKVPPASENCETYPDYFDE